MFVAYLGIGRVTEAALHKIGIERVEQLAALPHDSLEENFGQWGEALYRKARGQDAYEFFVDAEPKSISHSHTFERDTRDAAVLAATISRLCQHAAKRLREAGLAARTITLTLRYAGFETVTRSQMFSEPAHLDAIFLAALKALFERHWNRRRSLRLVGVELSEPVRTATASSICLARGARIRRDKLEKVARTADQLRDRFGFGKVQFGGSLGSGLRKKH